MSGEIAVGLFRHETEVLLIRRDERFPERWDAVSVRSDTDDGSVRRRLVSAVGIGTATFVRSADPIGIGTDATERTVRPYLFECETHKVAFDDPISGRLADLFIQ